MSEWPTRFYGTMEQAAALLDFLADRPCSKPWCNPETLQFECCVISAKGDWSWMCDPCKCRELRYGLYCLDCRCNHKAGMGDCKGRFTF